MIIIVLDLAELQKGVKNTTKTVIFDETTNIS